ncbi:MAG: cysteine desulfurase [Patescibacteria group bacterium]|nr:cysteine desulfurase [Patescibacteria group bacterium]
MSKIYFDYASTTPVDRRVFKEIRPYFFEKFGNPGSIHFFGQKALEAIDFSRYKIAEILGADFREIIFTGSATESNNLILKGIFNYAKKFLNYSKIKIIVSPIEHESILEVVKNLQKEGAEVYFLKVNKFGEIDLNDLKNNLDLNTVLVSIMYANNETGIIQPIEKIAKIINQFRKNNNLKIYPLFHTDAVQALQFLNCQIKYLGVDLMTLSGHKIYAPKGIGVIYIKKEIQNLISPLILGGGQEFGLRSGTENVINIVAFRKALELVEENKTFEYQRIFKLRNYFWFGLNNILKNLKLNQKNNFKNTLPNILNIYFPNKSSDELITKLDLAGVAVSSGSACKSRSLEPSHVLLNCGFSKERAMQSIRISLGRFTTKDEIDKALKIYKNL